MIRTIKSATMIAFALPLVSCNLGSCEKYASNYSCAYVIDRAEYEVWYWRNVTDDNEADNQMIGRAQGLRMCENTARAYAAAIGEPFNYRAYMCHLMRDGVLMEKHRFLVEYPS